MAKQMSNKRVKQMLKDLERNQQAKAAPKDKAA